MKKRQDGRFLKVISVDWKFKFYKNTREDENNV